MSEILRTLAQFWDVIPKCKNEVLPEAIAGSWYNPPPRLCCSEKSFGVLKKGDTDGAIRSGTSAHLEGRKRLLHKAWGQGRPRTGDAQGCSGPSPPALDMLGHFSFLYGLGSFPPPFAFLFSFLSFNFDEIVCRAGAEKGTM